MSRSEAPLGGSLKRDRGESLLAGILLWLMILLYVVFFGWLSLVRHETYQSSAMDLGYTDQVVWNTLHGRFMLFSTYQGVAIDLPLDQFRRTDTLLAYHVELLLVPISLLYLIHDGPVTLLLLQTLVIGLGALPAFLLARDHLKSRLAGLVFALAYLLAPAIEGANLTDFHTVALTPTLILCAFYSLHKRRYGPFLAFIVVAMSAREDIALLVAMIGAYVAFGLRERRVGAVTALLGVGWFAVCTQVILPHYSGLPVSPFLHRLAIFGPTVEESLRNWLTDPALLARWLGQPQIVGYLVGLLASAGFMSLFCPAILVLAAPVMAINVFSTWSWTYSEGAHYSASIAPFIIASGIYGTGFLVRQLEKRCRAPHNVAVASLSLFMLLVAGYHHWQIGISPLARSYNRPGVTAHHRLLREVIASIPPSAPISAQSNLYPHVAHREKAYLFPGINDAEYVLLDVTSTSYPISQDELYARIERMLQSGEFGIVVARDGCLLLRREPDRASTALLPDEFYTFTQRKESDIAYLVQAQFGDELELVGYDYATLNVVSVHQLPATVTTCWRRRQPLNHNYGFAFFFTRQDGAIMGLYDGWTSATLWHPTSEWQEGEVVCLETPILPIGRLRDVLVAVIEPEADPWLVEGRLRPIASATDGLLQVFEERTLLKLFSFP